MELPTVHVRKQALFAMLAEAILHYKKECYGMVLGIEPSTKSKKYIVTDALPRSDTKRTFKEVSSGDKPEKRLLALYRRFGHLFPHIGFFHSHTQYREDIIPDFVPSMHDIRSMYETGPILEFILAISDYRGGPTAWTTRKDGSIAGVLDEYRFEIAVYVLEETKPKRKIRRLKLIATRALRELDKGASS